LYGNITTHTQSVLMAIFQVNMS